MENEIKITSKIETSIHETEDDYIVESIVSLMGVTQVFLYRLLP